MDDEVYSLRQTVAEQARTITLLENEIVKLRSRLCDPHSPVLGGDFIWRCERCGAWLPEER